MTNIRRFPVQPRIRLGISLTEVLAVIAIIGLLIAITLPAVQYARGVSRRMSCSHHQRQIGLAIANYEAAYAMLPPGGNRGRSLFVKLLPYLEQGHLAQLLDDHWKKPGDITDSLLISEFICPADDAPRVFASKLAPINYAGCVGIWPNDTGFNGLFRILESFQPYDSGPIRSQDIKDGLSSTVAIGEFLRSNGSPHRLRVPWEIPSYFATGELSAFANACKGIPPAPAAVLSGDFYHRGNKWYKADFASTLYNHVLTPNKPCCLNGGNLPSAAATASSNHSGGANFLFADGHIDFLSNSVDLALYRKLASRSDGS